MPTLPSDQDLYLLAGDDEDDTFFDAEEYDSDYDPGDDDNDNDNDNVSAVPVPAPFGSASASGSSGVASASAPSASLSGPSGITSGYTPVCAPDTLPVGANTTMPPATVLLWNQLGTLVTETSEPVNFDMDPG